MLETLLYYLFICFTSAVQIQGVPLATENGISLIILPVAGGPLLRVATIWRTTETHNRHIPLHFSHNERTPVQISLQYLQCRVR
jgi:hypothetical protein